MNFLLMIPGLFTLLEKVIGPLFTSEAKAGIVSKIFGGAFNGTVSSLLGIIEGTVGKLEDAQIIALKGEIETLLSQARINEIDATSNSFLNRGWRPCLAWGLSIIVISHLIIAEIANVLYMIGYDPGKIAPLDSLTVTLIFGLLGLYMGARTVEKVNSNNTD